MITKHDINVKIQEDLKGPVFYLCREIVSFLTSEDAKNLTHITYVTLINGTGKSFSSPEESTLLIKATDYLSSNKVHLLDMHFQFIESDNEEPIPLQEHEISHLLSKNEFFHPVTGEKVDNYQTLIFPYFTPTKLLESIHG